MTYTANWRGLLLEGERVEAPGFRGDTTIELRSWDVADWDRLEECLHGAAGVDPRDVVGGRRAWRAAVCLTPFLHAWIEEHWDLEAALQEHGREASPWDLEPEELGRRGGVADV